MTTDNIPHVLQVKEEELRVEKRSVPTGKVRVKTVVENVDEVIREVLETEQVEITHVQVDKEVQSAPNIRMEGNTTIIPVVKQVLRVDWVLTEEVRVTRRQRQQLSQHRETVLEERVDVERLDASGRRKDSV